MNRSSMSILARILAEKNNMTISEAEAFIKQMFDVANGVMQSDKQLKIRWLGTFKVTSVKDRESVDVNTGERIIIGGRDKITFTPDNILKEIVNKPFAQFETVVVNDGVDFSEIDRKFAFEAKEEVSAPSDEQQIAEESETSPVDKAESIPNLVAEITSLLTKFVIKHDIITCRCGKHHTHTYTICSVCSNKFQRIRRVAKLLGHFASYLVANDTCEIYIIKWLFANVFVTCHYHTCYPEENDIRSCYECSGRIVIIYFFVARIVNSVKECDRPEPA